MIKLVQVQCLIFSLCLLSACGSSDNNDGNKPSNKTLIISGKVTYTNYQPDSNGLNYQSVEELPIRGAIVEVLNADGEVLASDNTSDSGHYSLTAPKNSSVLIVVKAALGNPATPNTVVVDNTNSGALYAMSLNVATGTSNLTRDFNAESGWDGSSYSAQRVAAPFAILDTVYQAQQKILAADSAAIFPALTINWSKNNIPATGNLTLGEIGTTYYSDNKLYILGAENLDTDEYDSHIIAHEWGHYFEDEFSRSDSPGGNHAIRNILHPSLAFSEGFGNAFSGMILDDPAYIDTSGLGQSTISINLDLDADLISDTATENNTLLDGFYSEFSVQEVLYDLFDSGASDDDSIALGFAPIYDVLTNSQKTTPAFTSIFSFLYYLKQDNPEIARLISNLALNENIGDGDEYQGIETPIYTSVPMDGSTITVDVDGFTLKTWTTYGNITAYDPGNKLYNSLFFKFSAITAGCYTLEATPTDGGDLIIFNPHYIAINQQGAGEAERYPATFATNEEGSFAVGSLNGEAEFTVKIDSTPSACN